MKSKNRGSGGPKQPSWGQNGEVGLQNGQIDCNWVKNGWVGFQKGRVGVKMAKLGSLVDEFLYKKTTIYHCMAFLPRQS